MAQHLRQRRSGTAPSGQPARAAQGDRQPHPPAGTVPDSEGRRDKALRACLCGTAAAVVAFLLLCMALVGGPRELFECCEPIWQPALGGDGQDPTLPPPLAGLTALVTGANRGYGYGAARHLAEQGARVIMACRNESTDAADTLAAHLRATMGPDHPGSVLRLRLDLEDLPAVAELAASAELPALDILVLNAAVVDAQSKPYKLRAPSGATLNRMYVVNFLANVVLVQGLVRHGKLRLREAGASHPAEGDAGHWYAPAAPACSRTRRFHRRCCRSLPRPLPRPLPLPLPLPPPAAAATAGGGGG